MRTSSEKLLIFYGRAGRKCLKLKASKIRHARFQESKKREGKVGRRPRLSADILSNTAA